MRIRPAAADDYPTFVRLFPELDVDDPLVEGARFVREIVPTALIAENDAGVTGYAFYQVFGKLTYVRQVVTAPEARRQGVGRALMLAIAERAREEKSVEWCLNVKPDNVAAIALYESLGMTKSFMSRSLRIDWIKVLAKTVNDQGFVARTIAPEDDAKVEAATAILHGQLPAARKTEDRVLLMLESRGAVVGAAIFAPSFPGAYPFRVTRPELVWPLLRAIHPHAAGQKFINLVIEGQRDVADALVAGGATVQLDIAHLKGLVPAAV